MPRDPSAWNSSRHQTQVPRLETGTRCPWLYSETLGLSRHYFQGSYQKSSSPSLGKRERITQHCLATLSADRAFWHRQEVAGQPESCRQVRVRIASMSRRTQHKDVLNIRKLNRRFKPDQDMIGIVCNHLSDERTRSIFRDPIPWIGNADPYYQHFHLLPN